VGLVSFCVDVVGGCLLQYSRKATNLSALLSLPFPNRMADLQRVASQEKPLVWDGRRIHKRAFARKGLPTPGNVAVIAGCTVEELDPAVIDKVIKRMIEARGGFRKRLELFVRTWWLDNARKLSLKRESGRKIETVEDILDELEANPTMESFQKWYKIAYEDREGGNGGNRASELRFMKELGVSYNDGTQVGGCVGELMIEVFQNLVERLQTRSKEKQGLHLVKSRPNFMGAEPGVRGRRSKGSYYIVRSDHQGNWLEAIRYNVSRPWAGLRESIGKLTSCLPEYDPILVLHRRWR
jgi:hypothetical protein